MPNCTCASTGSRGFARPPVAADGPVVLIRGTVFGKRANSALQFHPGQSGAVISGGVPSSKRAEEDDTLPQILSLMAPHVERVVAWDEKLQINRTLEAGLKR